MITSSTVAQNGDFKSSETGFKNERFYISWILTSATSFSYRLQNHLTPITIEFPALEINNRKVQINLNNLKLIRSTVQKENQVFSVFYEGS